MKFTEDALIIYPYVQDTQLIYEVDYEHDIRNVTQELPDLPDNERWECFGVNVTNTGSEVIVDVINVYT